MLAELRRSARGEEALGDERLARLYGLLIDWEYERPDDVPGGAPWSEPLGLLAAELEQRPGLRDHAVLAAAAYGTRLDREGRRDEAMAVLAGAAQRYAAEPYVVGLRLELGALLRAEQEFGRALLELRAAERLLEDPCVADKLAGQAALYTALVAYDLGATTDGLGMTDAAQAYLEQAEKAALALDLESGPAVWGGTLVYQLNQAIKRERPEGPRALGERFRAHAWRELVPEETGLQIRARLAFAEVKAASRGEAAVGAGEDELRALLAAGLKPEEQLIAEVVLAESLLDRASWPEARAVLDAVRAELAGMPAQEPLRLYAAGLQARLLRHTEAAPGERSALLASELRPALEGFLARAQRGPLEEAGVSLLNFDWSRAALCELFELEVAVDEGGAGAERAFGWLARLHAAGTLAREHGLAAPSLGEARAALLAPGRGLLCYVPGRVVSHVFALDSGGLALLRLGPAWSLARKAQDLEEAIRSAIGARGPESDARLAFALGSASEGFAPAEVRERLAAWRSVVVIGLDGFGYVPFEALAGPEGEPLGETHAVVYEPSLPLGVWLVSRAAAAGPVDGSALLYVGRGDPARGGRPQLAPLDLDPLRLGGAAFERAGVPLRMLDPGAPALPEALAGASCASFLVHGVYERERVRPAGLLIAPEDGQGAWFAEDFERLPIVPAVIIAACGTDRAPLRRGDDGRGHLRSAFFQGGALCVATATLALELESTVDLAAAVHARLAAGDSVAEAFHAARAAARPEAHGVHPVHAYLLHVWGAGDLRLVPAAPRRSRLPLALAAGAGLCILVAVLLRRG